MLKLNDSIKDATYIQINPLNSTASIKLQKQISVNIVEEEPEVKSLFEFHNDKKFASFEEFKASIP